MSKVKILIVEDESIVAKDIQYSLIKLGYTVCGIASNAEKAIELAASELPDLVLMDIMLKGEINGSIYQQMIRLNGRLTTLGGQGYMTPEKCSYKYFD